MHQRNRLETLFDRFCSDKGTFWQSRHHYASAYNAVFEQLRFKVASMIEVGIGEDTAPSVASWVRYFPNAHIYAIDVKTRDEFARRAQPGGMTERLIAHQSRFGCHYDRGMWENPRIHLTLGVDATNADQMSTIRLPDQVDIILDDGSHRLRDQEATLRILWPRLSPGGYYIVEDLVVGKLPWSLEHAEQVPSNNSACRNECFFPQRPSEHPLLFDRFHLLRRPTALMPGTVDILRNNDWFWVLTGVHRGGGVDASLIIRKHGVPLDEPTPGDVCGIALSLLAVCMLFAWVSSYIRPQRSRYMPIQQ